MPPLYRILEIILYSLLNFLPFLVLAIYPFRKKLRFPIPVTCMLVGIVTLIQIGLGVWAALFSHGNAGLISAVSTLVYLIFYFIAVNAYFGKKLFTLLMLSNIANFIVSASKCLEGLIFPDYALQSYRWTFSAIMLGVELIVLVPLFLYIRSTYSTAFDKDTAKPTWRYLWLIPATFYLIWYYHLYATGTSSLERALQPANTFLLFFINMGAMLVYHMLIRLINVIDTNVDLSDRNHALAMQNLQYENLQEKIAEARHAKHDIRHHISIMKSYLQAQEYDKLETYLNSYQKALPDDSTILFCDNRAVNVLLLYFAQQAKNHDIDYEVHAHVPENLNIPENNLSVLLGNLVENALDACIAQQSDEKRIIIHAKAEGTSLFLTIDNSYNGVVRQNKQGNYLSTKKNGSGLGLTSVRNIVERYDGNLVICHDNGVFRVSVMLNIPAAP